MTGGPATVAPTSGVPYGHVPGYLPGSSSLVEELDKRVLIVLRDGRHLVGVSAYILLLCREAARMVCNSLMLCFSQ